MDRAELMRRVRAGRYVVDPHAVAGAMLRRPSVREALLDSRVDEPVTPGRRADAVDDAGPASRPGRE